MPVKRIDATICACASLALAAIFSCGLAFGQERTDSELTFHIDNGSPGFFFINMESTANEAVTYDLGNGEIRFSAGDVLSGTYQNPLFCFGADDNGSSQVKLKVVDPNGHVIVEDFGLSSSLQYVLSNNEIAVTAPTGSRCFYKGEGEDATFGLFGKAYEGNGTRIVPPDSILSDQFVGYPELSITYKGLPSSLGVGASVAYEIEIHNAGKVTAYDVAFQELFPANSSVYDATLTEGSWSCSVEKSDVCPHLTSGGGSLRVEGFDIPPLGTVVFEVSRAVPDVAELAGQVLNLYAGVVSGYGTYAQFDTAEPVVDILGAPVALMFDVDPTNTSTGEDIDPPVVVHVVDLNGNRVLTDDSTELRIELRQNGSFNSDLTSWRQVTQGQLVFDDLSMNGINPGTDYSLRVRAGAVMLPEDSEPFEVEPAP